MAQHQGSKSGDGLSLQTLVIAAAASAIAAVVVSHVWKGGTVIAAAMTPVIVSIMKELLAKPMESEIVKKPVQQVSKIASGRIVASATPRAERLRQAGRSFEEEPFTAAPLPPRTERHRSARGTGPSNGHGNGTGNGHDSGTGHHTGAGHRYGNGHGGAGHAPDVIESHPRRTYGAAPQRGGRHLRLAVVTGVLAFVVAAVVLTVPELVFGGAVSSHHSTTLFGGGSSTKSSKKRDKAKTDKGATTQPDRQPPPSGQQTPTTPQPTTPSATTPAPTTPQSPAPTTPQATPPPSSGGTTTPSP